MRSFKKLITMVLAIAMVLTCVSIPAMAENSFSDITDQKVADAVNKLVAYKIITGYDDDGDGVAESFKPDNQITRAEFAAIVTRMKGVADNLPTDSVTGFSDLDNDGSRAWARPYVKAAVDLKIINGFEDGTFRAAEPVTYEQAVKMLVCAVGYEVVAQSEYNKALVSNPDATWSAGYITAANKHGITKGVITAQITQPASRGVVAVLTSNALEVPELVTNEQGNLVKPEDGKETTESNMQTITGIITGTHFTGVNEADPGLAEDEIYIDAADDDDDGEYKLSGSLADSIDLDQYIGRRVDAYYDNLEGEITSMALKGTTSSVIEEGSIESVSGYSIKYKNDKGKTTTEDLSNYTFIVNGKYVDSYDIEEEFTNGVIEFFTTGQYKIAKVNDYEVFVVNSFDKENEKIFLKYANYNGNNYYQFPTRSSDKPVIYVKNSGSSAYTKTTFDSLSLSQYDIINYLESPSGAAGDIIRKMYVTKGAKSGKVTAKLDGEREVEIGNDTLYLTQQYYNFEGNSTDEKAPFELSDNYTYYVDYTGQIAAVKYSAATSSGSWAYGYLIEVDKKEKQIGILDANGNYQAYDLKDTVRVDGEKTDASDVFDTLIASAEEIDGNANEDVLEETNGYAQPIRYSVSSSKIDALDTVLEVDGGTYDSFTYDGVGSSSKGSTSTTKVVADGTSYAVNSTTLVVYAPKNRKDDSSYAVMKPSAAFAVTANRYTDVFAVDKTSSNNLAKMVVVYGSNPMLNFIGSSPYMLVTKASSDGNTETFEGYVSGSASTSKVKVAEDGFETELEGNDNLVKGSDVSKGDIIRYIKNNSGEAVAIEMIYDASEEGGLLLSADEDYYTDSEGTGNDFLACYGTVNAKDSTDNTIEVIADKSRTYKTGSTKFFKLSSNGDVTTAVIDEISLEAESGEASTVVVIAHSLTENVGAAIIYIVE